MGGYGVTAYGANGGTQRNCENSYEARLEVPTVIISNDASPCYR